jgi:DNA repair exonuclease SbcCD ATPase subunit
MIISAVETFNWGPFSGRQRLVLGASCYGIEARFSFDEERSNAGGKSMWMEGLPFVMSGWLNSERGFSAGEWITDGEKEGGVRYEFDDGFWMERARDERLSKEKEQCLTSSGAKGAEAEREVVERLGLTREDLHASRFLRQRQAARFVLARPEQRMEVIGDWLRLGPLESAEKSSGKEVTAAEKEVERAQRVVEVEEGIQRNSTVLSVVREAYDKARKDLDELRCVSGNIYAYAEAAERKLREAAGAADAAERFAVVNEEGKRLAEELRGVDVPNLARELDLMRGVLDKRRQKHVDAQREERKWRSLAAGEFDGQCPVACIECPAKDGINADREKSQRFWEAASKEADRLYLEFRDQDAAVRVQEGIFREYFGKQYTLEGLREEALRLLPAAERGSPTSEEMVCREDSLRHASQTREEVRRLEGEASRLEGLLGAAMAAESRLTAAREELARAERVAAVAREGAAVFRSARRKIAEVALSRIERDANAALSRLTSGLSFELSWSRPGSGLAKSCDYCGEPFPRGEKAKKCARCGAVRGPSLVEKLEVVLSQQSAALEDLVGTFLSMASSKWLAEDRGSAFESLFLDEVTAHLDRSHRAVFGRKLPAILGDMGVRQGFVISHDSATIAALPGRLLVESDGSRSTVRVVS